jgi:hypothetical protein
MALKDSMIVGLVLGRGGPPIPTDPFCEIAARPGLPGGTYAGEQGQHGSISLENPRLPPLAGC